MKRRWLGVLLMLWGCVGTLLGNAQPALAATTTGSYKSYNANCPGLNATTIPPGCNLENSIYIDYQGPSGQFSNPANQLNVFSYYPATHNWINGCGATIVASPSKPGSGVFTDPRGCLSPAKVGSITLSLSPVPSAAWLGQTAPTPSSAIINIYATVNFGAADPQMSTPSLPEGFEKHTTFRIAPPPAGPAISPDISSLTSAVVHYQLLGLVTKDGQGIYNVCVGDSSGVFSLAGAPGGAFAIATDGEVCQRINKLNTAADVTFNLKGDISKVAGYVPSTGPVVCDAGPGLTWLICGLIRTLVSMIDWIRDKVIVPFLQIQPLAQTVLDDNGKSIQNPTYTIWVVMRNVASLFFILIFFLVIFGTALGFDNYTVKKVMPRLVAAAVFVPLSWYLCVVLIDIGNVLAQGLVSLTSTFIPAPTIDFTSSISKVLLGGVLIGATAAAATALATIGFGLVFSMVIALLAVFFTLVLRQILITLLVVLSPFAFVLWILPNTEKWFREWWTNMFKLVMMYPLVMGLFEAGRLFAATAGATAGNTLEKGVTPLFELAGLMLPLFAVPLTFKWAGKALKLGQGGISKAAGALDKRYGKNSEGAKQRAEQRMLENARRSVDKTNPMGSKTLGAIKRGVALKRSGLGGFTGNSSIPVLRNNAARKQRINTAAAKAEADEAQSKGKERLRRDLPQTSKERMSNQAAAAFDHILEERAAEAAAAVKDEHGVAIRSVNLDDSGIAFLKHQVRTGDAATKIAAMKRLSNSQGGIDALMALRTGEKYFRDDHTLTTDAIATRDTQLADGTRIAKGQTIAAGSTVKAGTYTNENASEVVHDANGQVIQSQAYNMGGDDNTVVSAEHKQVWDMGTQDSGASDAKKSLKSAATDISAEDMAGMSVYQVRRFMDFYERNKDNADGQKAAAQFNAVFQQAIQPGSLLRGKLTPEAVRLIAEYGSEGRGGINDRSAELALGRAAELTQTPRTVTTEASRQIIAATGGDVVRASQIHSQIQTEIAASGAAQTSALRDTLENKIAEGGTIEAADIAHIAPPAGPQTRLQSELARHFSDNLDQLAAVHRGYQDDTTGNYRKLVNESLLNDKKPPVPPQR